MIEVDKSFLDKIATVYRSIEEDRNSLRLFALIFRPDLKQEKDIEKWDLVISATWTNKKSQREAYEYIFSKIIPVFKKPESLTKHLNKVVLLSKTNEFVELFTESVGLVDKDCKEFSEFNLKGENFTLKSAYVFISKPRKQRKK